MKSFVKTSSLMFVLLFLFSCKPRQSQLYAPILDTPKGQITTLSSEDVGRIFCFNQDVDHSFTLREPDRYCAPALDVLDELLALMGEPSATFTLGADSSQVAAHKNGMAAQLDYLAQESAKLETDIANLKAKNQDSSANSTNLQMLEGQKAEIDDKIKAAKNYLSDNLNEDGLTDGKSVLFRSSEIVSKFWEVANFETTISEKVFLKNFSKKDYELVQKALQKTITLKNKKELFYRAVVENFADFEKIEGMNDVLVVATELVPKEGIDFKTYKKYDGKVPVVTFAGNSRSSMLSYKREVGRVNASEPFSYSNPKNIHSLLVIDTDYDVTAAAAEFPGGITYNTALPYQMKGGLEELVNDWAIRFLKRLQMNSKQMPAK